MLKLLKIPVELIKKIVVLLVDLVVTLISKGKNK